MKHTHGLLLNAEITGASFAASAVCNGLFKRSTGRPNRGVFIGKSFHTTRQSLIEACSRLQLLDDPKILQSLLDLPERPGDLVKK